jgi:hypothetical protein
MPRTTSEKNGVLDEQPRIGVGHRQRDRVVSAPHQVSRGPVGHIPQLFSRSQHPLPRRGADVRGAVDRARGGAPGDAGQPCDPSIGGVRGTYGTYLSTKDPNHTTSRAGSAPSGHAEVVVHRTTRWTTLAVIALLAISTAQSAVAAPAGLIEMTSGFYAHPGSSPAVWARDHAGDSRSGPIRTAIASKPIARWFGNWNSDINAAVSSFVGAADTADKLPILVAYNIPGRDFGGHSGGGAGSPEAYRTWISTFAAAIGNRPAVVVIEPDALPNWTAYLTTTSGRSVRT